MKLYKLLPVIILLLSVNCNKPNKNPIRKNKTIYYYLNKEANLLTEITVRQTFDKWSDITHFNFIYKGRHKAGFKRDGKNTVSFLKKWPDYIPMSNVGYCQNYFGFDGNIKESDIAFNMLITNFTTLRTNTPGSYYIEGVLNHEIAHMIGLNHINNDKSLLKPKSNVNESFFKGRIDKYTFQAYKKLYADYYEKKLK